MVEPAVARRCGVGVPVNPRTPPEQDQTLVVCGALIVEGPCRVQLSEQVCNADLFEHVEGDQNNHRYDGWICERGHEQEGPSDGGA